MKVLILFYSTYGHIYHMAKAVAEGAEAANNVEVVLRRVPETLSDEILENMGALEAQKAFSHIPVCTVKKLAEADAIIFGTPTRFGNMCGQMRQFLDATGQLWAEGKLVGKVRQRIYQFRNPARRPGINDSQFSYFFTASRNGHCRPAICVCRPDEN